jgi:hypothetical protein
VLFTLKILGKVGQPIMEQGFVNIAAAATYMGPGTIQVDAFQPEITDLVRRRFQFGQRIKQTKATGQPSRYIEQFSIPGAGFTDPRVINAQATQPSRGERALNLKALVAQINFGLFDIEVTQQQGEFQGLQAKDLTDMVNGIMYRHDYALWNGTDTDLLAATSVQYFGCSGQILAGAAAGTGLGVGTILPVTGAVNIVTGTDSIVDQLKTYVATMVARQDFEVRPTAIYANPLTCDALDKECKFLNLNVDKVQLTPGLVVTAIMTQAGLIPIVPDQAISVFPQGNGTFQHTFFIVSEDLVEYHYLTDPNPRVFQLGLTGNLGGQFVAVKFGAPVVKGASYAHGVLVMTR